MKPVDLPQPRPHSRREMDRMRRQRVVFFALVWAFIVVSAIAFVYLIATQGLELQFSLQIKP